MALLVLAPAATRTRVVASNFRTLWALLNRLAEIGGSDVILREALHFIFAGDNLSAAFLVTRSTPLNVRQAIDLLMRISNIISRVALEGYKHMEKQGRVSPEFVRAFEKHITDED